MESLLPAASASARSCPSDACRLLNTRGATMCPARAVLPSAATRCAKSPAGPETADGIRTGRKKCRGRNRHQTRRDPPRRADLISARGYAEGFHRGRSDQSDSRYPSPAIRTEVRRLRAHGPAPFFAASTRMNWSIAENCSPCAHAGTNSCGVRFVAVSCSDSCALET